MTTARPILFSAPMITALLDGRKTQTRRLVSLPRWADACNEDNEFEMDGDPLWPHAISRKTGCLAAIDCPYGEPGDALWCRETFAHYHTVNSRAASGGRSFSEVSDGLAGYRADGFETIEQFRQHVRVMSECDLEAIEIKGDKWKPSIFMPRWASRLTLRITDVRVERLQEITQADAIAEGVEFESADPPFYYVPGIHPHSLTAVGVEQSGSVPHAVRSYAKLWEHINGNGAWARNDWVWRISFECIKANVDEVLRGVTA